MKLYTHKYGNMEKGASQARRKKRISLNQNRKCYLTSCENFRRAPLKTPVPRRTRNFVVICDSLIIIIISLAQARGFGTVPLASFGN